MGVKGAHMVSASYLKAWSDDRHRVDVIDLEQGRGFTTAIGNATVVSYAYQPDLLKHDLEGEFAGIETHGMRAIHKARYGHPLSSLEKANVVAFLNMHLDRGRYADQTQIRTPAVVLKTDGEVENVELNLGDRLRLSQSMTEVLRLDSLGLERWPWAVHEATGLITGDGAVLLWRAERARDSKIVTVSFPISPTQLLVIGRDISSSEHMNIRVSMNSRRWLVGGYGTLEKDRAKIFEAGRFRQPLVRQDNPQPAVESAKIPNR